MTEVFTKTPSNSEVTGCSALRFYEIAFCAEHFTSDGECTLEGRDKVTKVAKKAGELWGEMDDESKQPFESQAAEAKAKYDSEMSEYKGSNPTPVDPEDDMPEAPEGWAGPFANTYIHKLAERKSHTSFAAAVARAAGARLIAPCGPLMRGDA